MSLSSIVSLDGTKRIGLIAGNGKFPLMFAREAKRQGIEVIVIAVKKDTSRWITPLVKKVYWLTLKDYGNILKNVYYFNIMKNTVILKIVFMGF